MPAIGYVTKDDNGTFNGQLKTLSIRVEINITPNARKASDVQPDYRVVCGDVEIGAGWTRYSEASGRDYVSLSVATGIRPTSALRQPRPGRRRKQRSLRHLLEPRRLTSERAAERRALSSTYGVRPIAWVSHAARA